MVGIKFAQPKQESPPVGLHVLELSIPKIEPAFGTARTRPLKKCDAGLNGTCSTQDITGLLRSWHYGDSQALNRLMPLVHDELRRLARRYMQRERCDHLLQTTALVNQAFIKLLDAKNIDWRNRTHFFAVSAIVMRRVLVDYARSRGYQKRGPKFKRVDLNERISAPLDRNLVALDDALSALAETDPRKAKVVELKFFGGLTIEEIARELEISPDRIKQEWSLAKRWLFFELRGRESHES